MIKINVIFQAIATGWGSLAFGGKFPNVLQEVEVQVMDDQQCHDYYGEKITKPMFCAGYERGQKDACQVNIWAITNYFCSKLVS